MKTWYIVHAECFNRIDFDFCNTALVYHNIMSGVEQSKYLAGPCLAVTTVMDIWIYPGPLFPPPMHGRLT